MMLIIVCLLVPGLQADDLPELKFEKYELSNGLDVILHEDHTIPVVAVNLWYHVGSKNEAKGRTGFAHLFEHLMFEGSEHHNQPFTESILKYGGTRNGSTGEDRTNYWENMPSNYLEKTLWLEADRMGYLLPAITQERLDIQRSVVMNEKRQNYDDQPYGRARGLARRLMYPDDHPYSWIPIGSMEDLQAASLEDVKDFFRQYYTPSNASLCIAGDFNPTEAKAWVEKYFGPIPAGPPVERVEAWVPVLNEPIRATMTDKVNLARVDMIWHTPAYYAPGDAELDLLASVLSSGKSSRLYKALVYDRQMAQDVNAYQSSREIGSTFHISVTAKEGQDLGEIEREVDRILKDVLTNGITTEEFERVRTNWEAGFVRRLESVGGFGGRAELLNAYNTYLGDPGSLLWDRSRYTDATIDGVLSVARKYLHPDARLVMTIVPQGELAAVDNGTDMSLEPAEQQEPTFTPPAIQKTTLSNGMELYLVENHKLPLVQMNLLVKSGWAADPTDRPGTAALTADLLNEGTKSRSALEISDEAQRLGLNFGTGAGYDNTTVSLNALKKNLDAGLELVSDVVLNPTFPEEELERLRQIYLGRIQQEANQPFTIAYKNFNRELYGNGHPYAQPYTGSGTAESITALTRDDILKYYRANFVPNNTAAIVVGDLSLDEAKDKLERAFKNWKRGDVKQSTIATAAPLQKTKICLIDKPGSAQSTVIIGNLVGSRSDPGYLPATVVSQVLGGGPGARLFKNLREDKGYTYGAYSFISGRRGQGALVAYAQVQTDFTKEAIVEFMKELRGIRGEIPVSDEELADSRNNLTKGFPQDFQSLGGVAGQLATIVAQELPLDEWQSYIDRINSVDGQTLLQSAGNCVRPGEVLIMVVGDRAKIEAGIKELNLGELYFSDVN